MPASKIKISKVDKTETGIPGLDEIIEGGLLNGSITTIAGDTGCGKSTFGIQFLVHGALNDEPGLYISFDEQKDALYRNTARFGWDLHQLEKQRNFVFIEYPPHELNHFIEQEGTIRDLVDTVGIERMVIDPVTTLELLHETELDKRRGMLKLMEKIRNWGCTTLLISEGKEDLSQASRTRFGAELISDGLIQLYNLRYKTFRERALEVVKMRGVAHECKVFPFKIGSKGIEVFPHKTLASA